MKDISILLPIHKMNEQYEKMLSNCLSSVENFHDDIYLLIISPLDIAERLKQFDFGNKLEVILVENKTSDFSFQNQINIGINEVKTKWFSILEIDDEYYENWIKNIKNYIKEFEDVDVFLPITEDVNNEGKFLGFTNESAWAYGFTNDQGFLDIETLLEFQNFQTSGGLFRTEKIKDLGNFKNNIELTFIYEFLLRLVFHNIKIMVIPKVCYKHINFRVDSLFWEYKNNPEKQLNEELIKFWVEVAKKEYFFKNVRDINIETSS